MVSTLPLLPAAHSVASSSELAENFQAAVDQFLERDAVMGGDVIEADVNFFFVILGAEIPGRAGLRQRTEPILAGDVGDVFHHLDDAFAGAAFSGEQPGLVEWDAITDGPLALRPGLVVPIGHVEPSNRLPGLSLEFALRLAVRRPRLGLFDQEAERLEDISPLNPVDNVLLRSEARQLDNVDFLGDADQRSGNYLGVLAARLVIVGNDRHVAAAQELRVLGGPLFRAAGVAGSDEPPLAQRMNLQLALDNKNGGRRVFEQLRQTIWHNRHVRHAVDF